MKNKQNITHKRKGSDLSSDIYIKENKENILESKGERNKVKDIKKEKKRKKEKRKKSKNKKYKFRK